MFFWKEKQNNRSAKTVEVIKSTIEVLKQGKKYVQSKNKDARAISLTPFWSLLLTLIMFYTLFFLLF